MNPKKVLILGAAKITSRRNAERYVSRGRAEWANEKQSAIRFFDHNHEHKAAQANAAGELAEWRPLIQSPNPQPVIAYLFWQICWRTCEAAVLLPSIEWMQSRETKTRTIPA